MLEREMQWLVEAAKRAQEKRKQFASAPLSSHIPTGFTTGLGTNAQSRGDAPQRLTYVPPRERALAAIDETIKRRQARPWEPTLSHQQYIEGVRATKAYEEQRAREFEEQMALEREKFELEREKFEAEERYRNAQLALQRLAAIKKDSGDEGEVYNPLENYPWISTQPERDRVLRELAGSEIRAVVDYIIADGGKWKDIMNVLESKRPDLAAYALTFEDALLRALEEYESAIDRETSYRPLVMGGTAFDRLREITQRAEQRKEYLKDLERARKLVNELLLKAPLEEAEREKTIEHYKTTYTPPVGTGAAINLP